MSEIYDNWERLVRATLRREQLREIGLRTPSDLSSSSSSSFNFIACSGRLASSSLPEDGPKVTAKFAAQTFKFHELAAATKNFSPQNLLGEAGSACVYKGQLKSGKVVAVKKLDLKGIQGNRKYLVEVDMLNRLHHPNIVNLIGYCADGDNRILVYKFMPLGSLKANLHDLPPDKEPLDWNTRMKIAVGVAKALEFLHECANPPVVHTDLKPSNILLDEDFQTRVSGFGLAKFDPPGNEIRISSGVLGTFGYCAPEYIITGRATVICDLYSFGVLLLELITGRKAFDNTRAAEEVNIVLWARSFFGDRRRFLQLAAPLLQGRYPSQGLRQVLAVAFMCSQENAAERPPVRDVLTVLENVASEIYDPTVASAQSTRIGPSTHGNLADTIGGQR